MMLNRTFKTYKEVETNCNRFSAHLSSELVRIEMELFMSEHSYDV